MRILTASGRNGHRRLLLALAIAAMTSGCSSQQPDELTEKRARPSVDNQQQANADLAELMSNLKVVRQQQQRMAGNAAQAVPNNERK